MALQPEAIEIAKNITLEEHVAHASSHLGRAARHLTTMQEHHGEVAHYGGLVTKDAAARNPEVVHHLVKSAEHLGRAAEQHQMALRHLNALTGNPDYGDNKTYKDGEKNTHEVGMHMLSAADHLAQLAHQSVAPAGETPGAAAGRQAMAEHHYQKIGEHLKGAFKKIDAAKTALDASLDPGPAEPKNAADMPLQIQATTEVPDEHLNISKGEDGTEEIHLFVPICEMKKAEMDTQAGIKVPGLIVRGWGSISEYKDSQGDIIDGKALIDAVKGNHPDAFCKWGNIRDMHKAEAIGNAPIVDIRQHPVTKSPGLWVETFIVDEGAIKKFLTKTYKGFSIGGQCLDAEPLDEVSAEAA